MLFFEKYKMSSTDLSSKHELCKFNELIKLFETENFYFSEEEMKKQTEDIIKLNIDYKSKCKLLKDNLKSNKNYNKLNEHLALRAEASGKPYPNLTKKTDIDLLFKLYELYTKFVEMNL